MLKDMTAPVVYRYQAMPIRWFYVTHYRLNSQEHASRKTHPIRDNRANMISLLPATRRLVARFGKE